MNSEAAHLDVGCGKRPRNPFSCSDVHGVDIFAPLPEVIDAEKYKRANVVLEGIPYPDNRFDSVSAFDFIEHIPRVLISPELITRFLFIEFMNEVWRVLKPGGIFYAVTPAYPMPEAFQDPTHVNIITDQTHHYFCRDWSYTSNYGFKGRFEIVAAKWVHPRVALNAIDSPKKAYRNFVKTYLRGQRKTHFLWQLRAVK